MPPTRQDDRLDDVIIEEDEEIGDDNNLSMVMTSIV